MDNTKPKSNGTQKKKFGPNKGKQSLLKSKANAASGYAHRQSLKAKKREQEVGDVYEYVQEKTRRSKVRMDLDRDEAQEFGDLDGLEDGQREALRARLIGEHDDDEGIDSEDDEEIDSDAAFEESDEERFAEFFPNKKKKAASKKKERSVRFAEVDLNEDDEPPAQEKEESDEDEDEDEDEEEEGDPDEFIDLLDVLDGKGEIDMPSDEEGASKSSPQPSKSQSKLDMDDDFDMEEGVGEKGEDEEDEDEDEEDGDDDEEDEEGDEGEEEFQITASDDEADEGNLDNLQSFVEALDTTAQKRKADEDPSASQQKRKRRLIQEQTETGAEDEFRVNASGSKLNLDDLLEPLATQSSSLLSLKKTTKVLGSSSKTKSLSAPLPQRAQEKLDRQAAYEQTKEEAEHLSFPLQAEKAGRVSNLELTAKFKPTTALESAVDSLLKSAKVREDEIQETEESMLKANNLTVEEVAQRRAELRKMRELMYRAEVKAKRVKKIKSKTYRKLKRKERERMAEKIDEEDSDDEEAQMRREMERARERATLRHKHTGKWARQMKHKHLDVDQRKEIEEMLDKGEKLKRRIEGLGSDESEEDSDDDMSDEEDPEKIKADAFDELQKLKETDGDDAEVTAGKKGKSVFEMKFMKDAMARQDAVANREVDDFMNELSGAMNVDSDDEEAEVAAEEHDPSSGVVVQRVGGRVVYRPGAPSTSQPSTTTRAPAPPSDTSSVTLKSTDLLSPIVPQSPLNETTFSSSSKPSGEINPWLAHATDDSAKIARKKNEVVVSKDSKSAEKSKNKLKKEARKRQEEKELAKDDATLEISMDNVLQLGEPSKEGQASTSAASSQKKAPKAKTSTTTGGDDSDEDSDANSEVDAQEQALLRKAKGKGKAAAPTAFQQRDLVALAFAGDNVVREFEEAKRREIEDDAPKEVDTTIPGWGSWAGAGMRKKPPKPERIKKIAGVDPTTRADYNKKHIIISEKRDKKAAKYLVKDLPYPYTSQAQFERTMERPLGTQWNTRVAFQRATLPRVVKKPGVIITPLNKAT
ncbi:small nucleolar ribonucleoprotein complex subunit Utp14 [Coprinopsis cinerea okayama7|uniref:Small nucleolar ribonucleoprotein complex subunit Utp14 n=1 Tax=Coprinopsis cinerea (strain Okayama-7 / 130 / ATCC MYA-4618 / FGSC 9003) TaxID=240176 RepID=D6RKB5_COPC7|nr:small nucleolar ribonucleoprotein complex subunit Utp14 [Coprinopsis cinerea okayama7\|eukprot:XP_002912236.1 small nucleolar ribonucleoprotein complex subunit Utp14 [Coprinopsis cinerea okayama7\